MVHIINMAIKHYPVKKIKSYTRPTLPHIPTMNFIAGSKCDVFPLTCENHFARHKYEEHNTRLHHAVDQAGEQLRLITAQEANSEWERMTYY